MVLLTEFPRRHQFQYCFVIILRERPAGPQTLGADPLLGVLGNDLSGSKLIEVLEDLKIDTEFVLRADGVMTTVKTRLLAGTQHLLRIDEEDISPLIQTVSSMHIVVGQVFPMHLNQKISKQRMIFY